MSHSHTSYAKALLLVAAFTQTVAAQHDGGSLVPEKRAKTPEILFAGGSQKPEPGIDVRLIAEQHRRALSGQEEDAYVFIQLGGPSRPGDLEQIEDAGAVILGYYPHYSYMARLPLSRADDIEALPFVRWVGYPDPERKVHPVVTALARGAPGTEIPVMINVFESQLTPSATVEIDERGGKRMEVIRSTNHAQQFELESLGARIVRYDDDLKAYVAIVPVAIIAAIAGKEFVLHVEPTPNPEPALDMSRAMINADYLRSASGGGYDGNGVTVGMIDTGYNFNHEDLVTPEFAISYCDEDWFDDSGHGSHVAGTIHGRGVGDPRYLGNAPGIQGADFQFVQGFCDMDAMVLGMDYLALSPRPQIINISGGDPSGGPWVGTDAASRQADHWVHTYGQIYVVAAGNEGTGGASTLRSPGAAKNVITIGSVDDFGPTVDNVSWFSSLGPTDDGRVKPDVMAPGRFVWAPDGTANSGYASKQGTSMATPHVTAAVAMYLEKFPDDDSPSKVKAVLGATGLAKEGLPDRNNQYGMGRISGHLLLSNDYQADGWFRSIRTGSLVGNADFDNHDIVISDSDVERLIVVLNWIERPAESGAGAALLNDMDLYVDRGADGTNEWGSLSYEDNVEHVVIENPSAGTYRLKVDAWAMSDQTENQAYALCYMYYRGDPNPDLSNATTVEPTVLRPGEWIDASASIDVSEFVAKGVRIDVTVPTALQITEMSRQTYDGITSTYDTGDTDPGVGSIMVGDVLHQRPRQVDWKLQALSEGYHWIKFDVTSDNAEILTVNRLVTVDGTPPSSSFTTCPGGFTSDNDVDVCWTATDNFSQPSEMLFRHRLDFGAWSAWSQTTCAQYVDLPDGNHWVDIQSRDAAGNTETGQLAVCSFTIDTQAPVVSVDCPVDEFRQSQAEICYSASDNISNQLQYRHKLDGGPWTGWSSFTSGQECASLTALTDGSHTLYVEASDETGNQSTTASCTFDVDLDADVTFAIVDQNDDPIPMSNLKIHMGGGSFVWVSLGEVVSLGSGSHLATIVPGINDVEQALFGRPEVLTRDESFDVTNDPTQIITFSWEMASLDASLEDQLGRTIDDLRWYIMDGFAGGEAFLMNDARRLPVTVGAEGDWSDGYRLVLAPAIAAAPGVDAVLSRRFTQSLDSGGSTLGAIWPVATLTPEIVDQFGQPFTGSWYDVLGIAAPPAMYPCGEPLELPVTEIDGVEIDGLLSGGYGLGLYPGLNHVAQTEQHLGRRLVDLELTDQPLSVQLDWDEAAGVLLVRAPDGSPVDGADVRLVSGEDSFIVEAGQGVSGLPVTEGDGSDLDETGPLADGYEVQIRIDDGNWSPVSQIELQAGEWTVPHEVLLDGEAYTIEWLAGVVDVDAGAPRPFALLPSSPAPFQGATEIRFQLPETRAYTVDIFDVRGRLVRRFDGTGVGLVGVRWDGTDVGGRSVAPGIYMYRLRAARDDATGRLVRVE